MKTITPQQVSINEKQYKDKKTGQMKSLWNIGLKDNNVWYNGAVFNKEETEQFQEGKTIKLETFEEEYNGKMYKKFKPPKEIDVLKARVKALEEAVFKKPFVEELDKSIATAEDIEMPF